LRQRSCGPEQAVSRPAQRNPESRTLVLVQFSDGARSRSDRIGCNSFLQCRRSGFRVPLRGPGMTSTAPINARFRRCRCTARSELMTKVEGRHGAGKQTLASSKPPHRLAEPVLGLAEGKTRGLATFPPHSRGGKRGFDDWRSSPPGRGRGGERSEPVRGCLKVPRPCEAGERCRGRGPTRREGAGRNEAYQGRRRLNRQSRAPSNTLIRPPPDQVRGRPPSPSRGEGRGLAHRARLACRAAMV
jgi:hypothetical protein